jgi:hypothetical protein
LFFQDKNTLTLFRWQHCYLFIWQLQNLHDECSLEKKLYFDWFLKNIHISTHVNTDQKQTYSLKRKSLCYCNFSVVEIFTTVYVFICITNQQAEYTQPWLIALFHE